MKEVLVACGDVDLLRKIVADLPPDTFRPIATKKGAGIAAKVSGRPLALAIIHDPLADGDSLALRQALKSGMPELKILCLGTKDTDEYSDGALSYPIPGPIFRNAVKRLSATADESEDLARWKTFYNELGDLLERLPNLNYYEMLGLKPSAPHHAIVLMYDQMSARYHPDRYTQHRNTKWGAAVYDRCNSVFKHLTEAFAVLTDRRLKRKYDGSLSQGETRLSEGTSFAVDSGPETLDQWGRTPTGKKFLRLAQGEIAKKNISGAIQNLQFAQSMENNPAIADKIAELQKKLSE